MPTKGDAAALPGARASARYVRISPMKARRVVDLVRGLPANDALTVLKFAPQAASEQVYKVLASAIANAENNERLDPDSLLVSEAYVDEGPTLRRFRPRAQGRAYRINKRTCHITIAVESVQAQAPTRRPAAKKAAAPKVEPEADVTTDTEAEVTETEATDAAEQPAKQAAKKTSKKAAKPAAKNAKSDEKAEGGDEAAQSAPDSDKEGRE